MEKISTINPGEILLEEFLKPMNITAYRLAKETNVPATRISQILKGKRKITADTALRFAQFFGNSPDFWLGIQDEYELRIERVKIAQELEKIQQYRVSWILRFLSLLLRRIDKIHRTFSVSIIDKEEASRYSF